MGEAPSCNQSWGSTRLSEAAPSPRDGDRTGFSNSELQANLVRPKRRAPCLRASLSSYLSDFAFLAKHDLLVEVLLLLLHHHDGQALLLVLLFLLQAFLVLQPHLASGHLHRKRLQGAKSSGPCVLGAHRRFNRQRDQECPLQACRRHQAEGCTWYTRRMTPKGTWTSLRNALMETS